eukprot:5886040-Prymnesium_polylepis.1
MARSVAQIIARRQQANGLTIEQDAQRFAARMQVAAYRGDVHAHGQRCPGNGAGELTAIGPVAAGSRRHVKLHSAVGCAIVGPHAARRDVKEHQWRGPVGHGIAYFEAEPHAPCPQHSVLGSSIGHATVVVGTAVDRARCLALAGACALQAGLGVATRWNAAQVYQVVLGAPLLIALCDERGSGRRVEDCGAVGVARDRPCERPPRLVARQRAVSFTVPDGRVVKVDSLCWCDCTGLIDNLDSKPVDGYAPSRQFQRQRATKHVMTALDGAGATDQAHLAR